MPNQRSRFSHRHLLALCTFLVPLGVLAWLGQSERRRQGEQAQQAVAREATEFVNSAKRALEAQLDRQLPAIAEESKAVLAASNPVRAARILREREQSAYRSLLDIVLLDDSGRVLWPSIRPDQGLPLLRDPRVRGDGVPAEVMQTAEFLLTRGEFGAAEKMLQRLLDMILLGQAPEQGSDRANLLDLDEVTVRFRLGCVQRRQGNLDGAAEQFRHVVELTGLGTGGAPAARGFVAEDFAVQGLLAETALAEITDDPAQRLQVLRAIAEGARDSFHDSVLDPLAQRLLDSIPEDASCRAEAVEAMRDERARVRARSFAAECDGRFRERIRDRLQQPRPAGNPAWRVITTGHVTSILVMRAATPEEHERMRGLLPTARIPAEERRNLVVGLRLDLSQLLAGTLESFFRSDASFELAITDPDGVQVVAPPGNVPADFTAPVTSAYEMDLAAYPADADGFVADARAAERNAMLLVAALFAAALAGALWLWRSVTREAELASLKVDLVSRVSHELKTPLALIRMYGETIRRGRTKDAAQAAGFGAIIERESDRLTTLIQRILDFSRQQAGTLRYAPEPGDAVVVANRVAEAYRPHLESRGVTLQTALPDAAPLQVDAAALEAVLVNLLENAAKYQREEGADRTIELVVQADPARVVVEVRDRGRGIPDGEQERIFESFFRASNAGEVRGAGLGLSLVRHFATAHGGTVRALPRHGGGTIIQLVLPRLPTRPTTAPDVRKP